MPREGRRRKRKERSNKEVDISSVGAGALNTFLLHFNDFLKSIFMQIEACLSKDFTKAKPGAGSLNHLWPGVAGTCHPSQRDMLSLSPCLQHVASADMPDTSLQPLGNSEP